MATVKLGSSIGADAQLYPALADLGVPDDGLITKAGVEIADENVLDFIRAKCRGVEVEEPKPTRKPPKE